MAGATKRATIPSLDARGNSEGKIEQHVYQKIPSDIRISWSHCGYLSENERRVAKKLQAMAGEAAECCFSRVKYLKFNQRYDESQYYVLILCTFESEFRLGLQSWRRPEGVEQNRYADLIEGSYELSFSIGNLS